MADCRCAERRQTVKNMASGKTSVAEGSKYIITTLSEDATSKVMKSLNRRVKWGTS